MAKLAGTRSVSLLIGALDALVVAGGLLLLLIAGTSLSWWLDAGATGDWLATLRNAVDIWFAMHGVDIIFGAGSFGSLDIPAFVFSAFPIGAVLLIFAFAWRGGVRLFGSSEYWPAWIGAGLVYGGVSALLLALSATKNLSADPVTAYLFPPVIYVGGLVCGSLFSELPRTAVPMSAAVERIKGREWVQSLDQRLNWVLRSVMSPALRAGTGFVFVMQAISAIVVGVLVAVNWLNVIQLFEQLQGGVFGGLGSTLMQIAFLPNLTYFASSWLVGVGFAIGTGSSVSPLGTALGPIPTVPIFGTIPAGDIPYGMLVLVFPVLVALIVTLSVKSYAAEARHNFATPLASSISLGLSIGFVAAVEMTILAFITHLSIGPGRMQQIGADPLWIFVWVFLEVAPIAFLASFYVAKPNAASPIPEHLKR